MGHMESAWTQIGETFVDRNLVETGACRTPEIFLDYGNAVPHVKFGNTLKLFRRLQASSSSSSSLVVGVLEISISDRCARDSPGHSEVGNILYDEGLCPHDRVFTDASPLQDSSL